MPQTKELHYTQLKNGCCPQVFSFDTTEEISPLEGGVMGQERAVKAFDFGLMVKMQGYNIFMTGPSGTGKTTYAKISTKKAAAKEPVPYDWCYVYHFQNPRAPLALRFLAGMGKQFKEDMAELVQIFKTEIQKAFRSEDYENQKNAILKVFEEKKDVYIKQMSDMAKENGFQLRSSNSGIYFMPIIDGKTINEEEYEKLEEAQQEAIDKASNVVQEKAGAIMRDLRELEKEFKKKTDDLDYKVGMFAIGHHVSSVQEKYKE